ncbi:MAG: flagellar hook-length control protein FliK [Nitrospira sp.]|nr:flagellar hook-length control protein FliK [Nitrospira sp.]
MNGLHELMNGSVQGKAQSANPENIEQLRAGKPSLDFRELVNSNISKIRSAKTGMQHMAAGRGEKMHSVDSGRYITKAANDEFRKTDFESKTKEHRNDSREYTEMDKYDDNARENRLNSKGPDTGYDEGFADESAVTIDSENKLNSESEKIESQAASDLEETNTKDETEEVTNLQNQQISAIDDASEIPNSSEISIAPELAAAIEGIDAETVDEAALASNELKEKFANTIANKHEQPQKQSSERPEYLDTQSILNEISEDGTVEGEVPDRSEGVFMKAAVEAAGNISREQFMNSYTKSQQKTVKSVPETEAAGSVRSVETSSELSRAGETMLTSKTSRAGAFHELLNKVSYVIKGNNKLGVTVENDFLGKLKIDLKMHKGILQVQVNSSDAQVREQLENNMQQIIQSLSKEGLTVGGFSVSMSNQNHKEQDTKEESTDQNDLTVEEVAERRIEHHGLVNIFA